jgi:hypothetical protein
MCGRYADGMRYTDEGIDEVQKGRKLQEATCLYENITNTTSDNFIHTCIHTFYGHTF